MVDAPEKIWIEQDDCPYFYEESELVEVGSPVTEYTRSDLATELEAENERLKHALEAEKKRADEAEALAESMSFTAAFIGANPPTDNLEYYKIWNECSEAIATAVCLDEDIHVRMAQVRALLKRHKDAIAAEAELAKVTDPNAVHVNMLRGTIAKPSVAQIKHLYGDAIADPAELATLRAEVERRLEEPGVGWLYQNPDTGVEFSGQHPIKSGEVDDAEHVRPATAENILPLLLEAWADLRERDALKAREDEAEPVRAELTALRARVAELEAVVVKLREAIKRFAEVAEWDIGDNESDSDTFHPMDPRYSVSGNISIGHLRRAHEVMEETDWVADKIPAQKDHSHD